MSDTNAPFLFSVLSFATRDDLEAFDVAGLSTGAVAFVRENVGDFNDPDNQDLPFYVYFSASEAAVLDPTTLPTQNAGAAGTYPGRWIRQAWTFNVAP